MLLAVIGLTQFLMLLVDPLVVYVHLGGCGSCPQEDNNEEDHKILLLGMLINLKGKTALVTGSLEGVGKGIADALVKAGANMILHGFASEDVIDQRIRELKTSENKVEYVYADLNKSEDITYLMRHSMRVFGGVDILVNNAGKTHNEAVQDIPNKVWEEVINVNLNSSFQTTKGVIDYMQQKGWGRIINIAGVHGLVGMINKGAFTAAKHALIGLTKSTALEHAKSGITCNAICPGLIMTKHNQKYVSDMVSQEGVDEQAAIEKLMGGSIPSKKQTTVQDVGELVMFLSSKYGNNINGSIYTVDGGWMAQ